MVNVNYISIIIVGIGAAYYNAITHKGAWAMDVFGMTGQLAQIVTFVVFVVAGWVVASVLGGLIVTLLDIRDDINDRLPDARRDN